MSGAARPTGPPKYGMSGAARPSTPTKTSQWQGGAAALVATCRCEDMCEGRCEDRSARWLRAGHGPNTTLCRARLQPNTTLCRARLQRTRDVEPDSMLKTALSAAPPNTTSVWLREYEVRMEAASTAVEAKRALWGRKRSRRGTTLPVESDDLSLCRSGRHCVIVRC